VILSHLRNEHIGSPGQFAPAELVLGAGGKELLERGYLENPEAHCGGGLGFWVLGRKGSVERPWAISGTLWIIDAPAHLGGHLISW